MSNMRLIIDNKISLTYIIMTVRKKIKLNELNGMKKKIEPTRAGFEPAPTNGQHNRLFLRKRNSSAAP